MDDRYKDVLGEDYFNCCWMARMPQWMRDLGATVGRLFNVIRLLYATQIGLVILHLSNFQYKETLIAKFSLFHHLCVIPMCGIVGLYMIFKQRRPCFDTVTQRQIGTLYGMPSGDALFSGIAGMYIMRSNPGFGLLLIVSVIFSRISLGYHSLLQALVGASFGIIISYLQSMFGDRILPFIWLGSLFLPFLICFEPKLKQMCMCDPDNMFAWLFYDICCLLFDYAVCGPRQYNIFYDLDIKLRLTLFYIFQLTMNWIGKNIYAKGISLVFV